MLGARAHRGKCESPCRWGCRGRDARRGRLARDRGTSRRFIIHGEYVTVIKTTIHDNKIGITPRRRPYDAGNEVITGIDVQRQGFRFIVSENHGRSLQGVQYIDRISSPLC